MVTSNIAIAIRGAIKSAEEDCARNTAKGAYSSPSYGDLYRRSDRARNFIACLSGRLAVDEPELAAELSEFLLEPQAARANQEAN